MSSPNFHTNYLCYKPLYYAWVTCVRLSVLLFSDSLKETQKLLVSPLNTVLIILTITISANVIGAQKLLYFALINLQSCNQTVT